ncbi:hypothetical protein Ade02nite_07860 [Paractinoplanes deccanensis]|uniref:LPXTG cell wall anchor domain-containing protein n=1 Tax=Paractinoplanes deccanensis TaxID=113561 RepID=A0ABQ3XWL8_9ACTN|nr:hypothetical protein [Actinoplanes deccanensis]GID72145.1 hypothetical protein Ade02nite_07860 [Actinoplanes deccanensis]
MNLLKTKLRRTGAVLAGSLIGLTGVAVFAAPASAHAPVLSGETSCIKGGDTWHIDWSIANDYTADANITVLDKRSSNGTPVTVTGAEVGTFVAKAPRRGTNGPALTATTDVSTSVRWVELTVVMKWTDGYSNWDRPKVVKVYKPNKCTTPTTPPTTQPTTPPTTPPTTAPTTEPTTTPPTTEPTTEPTTTPPTTEPTTEPTSGPPVTPTSPSSTPTPTPPVLPVPTPSTTEPAEFTPILEEDCDTITIGIDNPANGIEWQIGYETSKGEKRNITVAPGEKKAEKFSATEGFWVKVTLAVTIDGETYSDFTQIDYTKPADCEEGGSGGGLPVTGAAAGSIAGGAAVLLAIGGVLFYMARRRKVKFTA